MDPSPFETPPPSEPSVGPTTPPGAMVIVIQSQMTVIISLAMLVIGLLVGFLLRPAVWPTPAALVEVTREVVATAAVDTAATEVVETLPTVASTENASVVTLPTTPTPDRAAQAQELMRVLIAQTRHFTGSEDATVTLIEFSDFQ